MRNTFGAAALVATIAILAASLAAPALGQAGGGRPAHPRDIELRRDLEDVSTAISWIDYVLSRTDQGDMVVSMEDPEKWNDAEARVVPVNRDVLLQVVREAVASGEITSAEGAAMIVHWGRASGNRIRALRQQRAELVKRQADLRARLARPPAPLRPWELGRPPTDSAAGQAPDAGSGLVGDRFSEACAAIAVDACARLYADLSVMLARYGGRIGWINGMDASAPGDPGRGITAWQPHYNHGVGPGVGRLGGLISQRLDDLHLALDPGTEAQMEREANGVINGYSRKY